MRKIIDIKLSPAVIQSLKQLPDGAGVILYDCEWYMESIADQDKVEECYIITNYKRGTPVFPKEQLTKNEEVVENREETIND